MKTIICIYLLTSILWQLVVNANAFLCPATNNGPGPSSSSSSSSSRTTATTTRKKNHPHEVKMMMIPADEIITRSQQLLQQDPLVQIISFAAAFRTGAAISVINQPQMPSIKSSSSSTTNNVGSRVTRLPSGARVRLFYPTTSTLEEEATTTTSITAAPYCTDGRQTSDGMAGLVGFRQLGLSFLLAHLSTASSGCIQDAPISSKEEELPLLIYSHGYGGNMDMATYFFRTMASKGMIVAAVEHTDGTASSTVLKNGRERKFNQYFMTGRQQLTRRASELLEAVEYIPNVIQTNYTTSVSSIMLGGHSYGCPSAIMAANGISADKTQIDGLILHDPALGMGYGMLPPNGSTSKIHTISYISDEYNRDNVRYGDLTLHVKGCYHGNFVDAPLWAPRFVMRSLSLVIPAAGPAPSELIHEQLANSALAFIKSKSPNDPLIQIGDLFEFIR